MKWMIALFFLIPIGYNSTAQIIKGKIISNDARPIYNASVTLLYAKDSSLVKSNAANLDGIFSFEGVKSGNYLLSASSLGYVSRFTHLFHFDTTKEVIQNIVLEKQDKQLENVTVIARKPPFVMKAGSTIVNVDASPTNAGLNVLELLEKSPGVTVDQDGNVSLKGKSGVLILVDGKPTYMSGSQLTNFLKSMQSSNLDQIEIMTTPPAKYDAAGNAGVINIKTKKGTVKGLNGNLTAGYQQGYYPRWNGSLNLNYRNGKYNIFGSYSGGHIDGKGSMYINRILTEAGTKRFIGASNQETNRRNFGNYNTMKIGMDYQISQNDIIGLVVSGDLEKWHQNHTGYSNLFNDQNIFDYKLVSDGKNTQRFDNIVSNLNYSHKFDSLGKELTIDMDHAYYENNGLVDLQTSILNASGTQQGKTIFLNGVSPSNIRIYSAKSDYTQTIAKKWKWGVGIKLSSVNTNNTVTYKRNDGIGWIPDLSRNNHFIYRENISAAYTTLSTEIKKWELSGGLRIENTTAKGNQRMTNETFTRNYTNLFPTIGVSYKANDKNQYSLAYNRRVTRPDYESLNPFTFFLDSLTYGMGNPMLQPQFTNNVELSHTFNRFLTTTLNYTETSDIITQLLKQEGALTFQTTENFSKMQQFGITSSANFSITKWWRLNLYGNFFINRFKGLYNDGITNYPLEQKVNGFTGNATSSMTFAKKWNFELSGWYASKNNQGLIITNPLGALNTALSRQLFDKKASVKIGVSDIFSTLQFGGYARYAIVNTNIKNRRDNRRFSITFTYKFGRQTIAASRNRSGGAEDEQSRVKSGGN